MDDKNKSSSEILGGVVLNEATLRLIGDFTEALKVGNKINREQLKVAEKQDKYFTGKDGFVKDVAKIIDESVTEKHKLLTAKIVGYVSALTTAIWFLLNKIF